VTIVLVTKFMIGIGISKISFRKKKNKSLRCQIFQISIMKLITL